MPKPAASGSKRLQVGAVLGRQPRALPLSTVLQSTSACTHLPALTCLHNVTQAEQHQEPNQSGVPLSAFPIGPALALSGDQDEPLSCCPIQ